MRIVIGSDHAGFALKEVLASQLRELGYDILDVGAHSIDKLDDYPDFAEGVGKAIIEGKAQRGVLICGSGVGVSVAANKMPGIRAAICHDTYSAHQGVEHDNMNVLVLGSRIIGSELAHELVRAFVAAQFSGEERHRRRLAKVDALEARYLIPKAAPSSH